MKTPLVSVVCTTFNHERYIARALDGMVSQLCDFSFEIIVHDDASTDRTAEIIREYEARYPELIRTVLQTENQYSQGHDVSNLLYRGMARGKYLALCEGDDFWTDPRKLQVQVDFLEANPDYSMCFHNAIVYEQSDHPCVRMFSDYNSDRDLSLADALGRWVVPTASMVGLREVMATYNEWLCKIYSGDYPLILTLFNAGRVRYLDRVMSVYRKVAVAGAHSASSRMLKRNIFMLEQKIILLECFNERTGQKYDAGVSHTLADLKQELRFQRAKEKRNVWAMLGMPLFWSKLFKKITH